MSLRRRLDDEFTLWASSLICWGLAIVYFASGEGLIDFNRHALGRDFVNYWTASHLLAEGRTLSIFDPQLFGEAQRRLFDADLPLHIWSYPPPALLLVAPLAPFGYLPALVLWSLAGALALWAAIAVGVEDPIDRALVLLSPAVAANLAMGQNGAFTGALLIAGLSLMNRRPVLAGALFGLLVFKPQLGLMLPVAVIAAGRWRTLASAAVTAVAVVTLSAAVFGPESWSAFFGPTLRVQARMMTEGTGPFLFMMPSAFAAGRLYGLASPMLLQVPFLMIAVVVVWRTWRTEFDADWKVAVTLLATIVATPQCLIYDMIPAMVAAIALFRGGMPADRLLAAVVWMLPVITMALNAIGLPVGALVLTAALLRLHQRPFGRATFAFPNQASD